MVFGQRSQLYWDLPADRSFELLRAIYGSSARSVPPQPRRVRRDPRDGRLPPHAGSATLARATHARRFCGGAAARHRRVVYLDEPTIGLDVVAKEAIREFIARINAERGTTIILTTHDLADVERLCRRIVLIDRGTLIYDGDIERIKSEYGRFRTLVVRFSAPVAHPALDGAELAGIEDSTARFRFDRNRQRADRLVRQASERYSVEDVSLEEPELESIIRRIYVEGYEGRPEEGAS